MRRSVVLVALLASAPVLADAPAGQAKPVAPRTAAAAVEKINKLAPAHNAGPPEGGAWAGQFEEGQTLRQAVVLQPNKCYVLIAVGLDGVKELDAMIVSQFPPLPQPITLVQDNTTGPDAIIGDAKSGCYKFTMPRPAPGSVVIKATRGAGLVAAQFFAK